MKKLTLILVCLGLLSGAVSAVPPIAIAVVESPASMDLVPFASRVNAFVPDPGATEEDQHHGVAVSSVLVGEGSRLPQDISITLFPGMKNLSDFLKTQPAENLILLNWNKGLSLGPKEEWLEEMENLRGPFLGVIDLVGEEFQEESALLIKNYGDALGQLGDLQNGHYLRNLFTYAKRNLEIGMQQKVVTREQKFVWQQGLEVLIKEFSIALSSKERKDFAETKDILREAFREHPNILLVWALGNEGKNIDTHPSYQAILEEPGILDHTLFVYGTVVVDRHRASSFTEAYAAHAVGRPFMTRAWHCGDRMYIRGGGTSFSAPLATIDAFLEGQRIFKETGRVPLYSDVKALLLSAGPIL